MNNIDREIQKKLDDPNWCKHISKNVIAQYEFSNKNNFMFQKIVTAAAIIIFFITLSANYYFSSAPENTIDKYEVQNSTAMPNQEYIYYAFADE